MQIFNELVFKDNVALALGFFDGVHIAHKKVISSCVNYAKQNDLKSAVLTFSEHPCVSIWNVKPQYIIPKSKRIEYIENLGVDYLYILDFSKTICSLSPGDFLTLLNNKISPKAIFTGYNFFFGKNKSGNTKFLKDYSKTFNYEYFEISEQKINDISISSTNIRNCIASGDIKTANLLLGYNYSFDGKVIQGKKVGRTIGFPTANLEYSDNLVPLKNGVYAVKVLYNQKEYDAVMNFGLKPTVNDCNTNTVEVHILNFNENIYNKEITVFPKFYIREQKKFDSLYSLKNQISNDISKIKFE